MSDSPVRRQTEEKPSNGSDKFNELRNILFPERDQFDSLKERFENPEVLAENVSRILPDAVRIRSGRDEDLTQALSPSVEKAIRISVQKDPRPLVDAIFPVMGPAIRKAISAAIAGLIQSLNQTLEYSLSFRGLKWRWEAIRTGKSFAEIVLLHSLLYRVEQIFLIHRESGLLLQHVSTMRSESADLISGMLTAIQDFVRDSFHVQETEMLETMQVGELNVWIEQGPYATLAAVIRGNAPKDLRSLFQSTLERIHLEKGKALQNFQGDTSTFESIRGSLEDCLVSQYQEQKKKKRSAFAWFAIGSAFAAIAIVVGYFGLQRYRLNRFVDGLNSEPGIVVTNVKKEWGAYHINGLRDPLAIDPETRIAEAGLDPANVRFNWEPYQALHPDFVLRRAKATLNPPSTVVLQLQEGVLVAKGEAPALWIADAGRLSRAISGVLGYDASELVESELTELRNLKQKIEERVFRFQVGTASLLPGQETEFETLSSDLLRLVASAKPLRKKVTVEIRGHTDTTGDEIGNRELSQARADSLIERFASRGVPAEIFVSIGKASEEPLREEKSEQDREWNRRTTFHVDWTTEENQAALREMR